MEIFTFPSRRLRLQNWLTLNAKRKWEWIIGENLCRTTAARSKRWKYYINRVRESPVSHPSERQIFPSNTSHSLMDIIIFHQLKFPFSTITRHFPSSFLFFTCLWICEYLRLCLSCLPHPLSLVRCRHRPSFRLFLNTAQFNLIETMMMLSVSFSIQALESLSSCGFLVCCF